MARADGRRSGSDSNSVQADYDGTPMVTDLMHDETALALASVLGERNEGFIQMSYVPDASKYEGDMQDHTEHHFEELALAAGRPILYNAIAVNDAHPERFRRQLHWLESCAQARYPGFRTERDARSRLPVHLQGLEPVGRYAGMARSDHRSDRRSPDEALRSGAAARSAQSRCR